MIVHHGPTQLSVAPHVIVSCNAPGVLAPINYTVLNNTVVHQGCVTGSQLTAHLPSLLQQYLKVHLRFEEGCHISLPYSISLPANASLVLEGLGKGANLTAMPGASFFEMLNAPNANLNLSNMYLSNSTTVS